MYYKTRIKDYIRLPPVSFSDDINLSITQEIKKKYNGFISQDIGFVIDVSEINAVGKGVVLPGDGSAHYQVEFTLITFKPELQEIVMGKVTNVADFGAFINIGPIEGMIHISQTMNDFVSFGKDGVLSGKNTKQSLKVGDICRARIIAVSYKDISNPKIGLTMRQPGLGRDDWAIEGATPVEKEAKEEKKAK